MVVSPFDVIFNDLTIRGFSVGNPSFASAIPEAIAPAQGNGKLARKRIRPWALAAVPFHRRLMVS
jgi:hypothetical protein